LLSIYESESVPTSMMPRLDPPRGSSKSSTLPRCLPIILGIIWGDFLSEFLYNATTSPCTLRMYFKSSRVHVNASSVRARFTHVYESLLFRQPV